MKFGALQFLGLAAVVGFGGYLAYTFLKPKTDPLAVPGAVALTEPAAAPAPTPPPGGAPPAADPLTVGSQDARDDLYCSGVIFAAHRAIGGDLMTPEAQKRRDQVIALAERGTGKLIAEGVATRDTTASIADAHSGLAETDYAAKTLRIPEADCFKRADVPT